MFYMFSGPDFLYADAFYPKATTYVLSALEPLGSVPDLTKLPRGGVGAALYDVEHSMSSILSFSFFITKHMKTDLRAGELSGTLPILYVFLARSGKTIRDVSPVALDDKGRGAFASENAGRNRDARRADRVRRQRWRGKDAVLFLSTDLSNSSARGSGFLKFCETLAPGNSLLKSASYLLYAGNFSHGARLPARQQRNHHPGRFRHSARRLQPEEMAVLPVRPLCRTDRRIPGHDTRRTMPNCSGGRSRWISASAIAGDRINPTCCCRSGLPPTAGGVDATAAPSADATPPKPRVPQASSAGADRADTTFLLVFALAWVPHLATAFGRCVATAELSLARRPLFARRGVGFLRVASLFRVEQRIRGDLQKDRSTQQQYGCDKKGTTPIVGTAIPGLILSALCIYGLVGCYDQILDLAIVCSHVSQCSFAHG